jgi:ATP-dependent protease ClpP protease subunit
MIYCINPESSEPIMLLDQPIGLDSENPTAPYIDGQLFARELLALDEMGKQRIQVRINSVGGLVTDGMSIYNAILKTKTPVDTYNIGVAASIAGVIFQAGRNRIMADYSKLMYHEVSGGDNKSRSAFNEAVLCMTTRCGMDEATAEKMMKRTSWVDADEALEMKLCSKVENSSDYNAMKLTGDPTTMWNQARLIYNNASKPNGKMKLSAKALGLPETASDEDIAKAISELQNKMKKTAKNGRALVNEDDEPDGDEAENRLRDMVNKTVAPIMAKNEALEKELNDLKNASAANETAVKKDAATAMVNKHIDRIGGKDVADDIKNSWIEKATADLEGTEKMILAIPVNKASGQINTETELTDAGHSAVGIMNKIAEKHNQLPKF